MRRYSIVALFVLLTLFGVSSAFAASKRIAKSSVPARERIEQSLPHVTVTNTGAVLPDLHAAAAIVYNPVTGEVLYQSNAEIPRSIASITKVMTATVFLEYDVDLSQKVLITAADVLRASHTFLRARDVVTVDDLLHLLLIASDNVAARALARISPVGATGFIDRMNLKAVQLGLSNTMYADSSGLLKGNMSTALETARLISLVADNDYISSVMQTTQYTFRTAAKRPIIARTTDHLLVHPDVPVMAAKTGFTSPAGYCLASLLRLPSDETVAIVVLGARSNAERFIEVENLYQWTLLHSKVAELQVEDVFPAVHLSERGFDFIRASEGFHATPYFDSGGYAVGYGFHYWQGKRVTKFYPRRVTVEDADAELQDQMLHFENIVHASIDAPLSQSAYDAMVSLSYNLGRINSEIVQKLNRGYGVSPGDFFKTATVHDRPNVALQVRRHREFAMMAGDYTGTVLTK